MKKVLLTTSALTLLAGAAAADVSVAGYSRIGISNTGSTTTNIMRNQLTFTGSATTDGGLSFSAWTRTRSTTSNSRFAVADVAATATVSDGDESNSEFAVGMSAFAAPMLTMSNGAVTLALGNITGAVSSTGGPAVYGCGTIMWGCDDLAGASSWTTQSSNGSSTDAVRLDMALGSANVSVSGGNGNDTEVAMNVAMGSGTFGVGYDQETNPNLHVGYSGSAGGLGIGVRASQSDGKTGYMANVTAPVGAGSIYVFAGKTVAGSNNYGLRYNQSLGGSVAMQAGASSVGGTTTVGAGLNFSF
jgi:outer membrane protein OmpU